MRKNLLLMLMAFLLPCFAWADNKALQKTIPSSYYSYVDYRLVVPTSTAGVNLPQTQDHQSSYAVAQWIKISRVYNAQGAVLMDFGTYEHLNKNGNWNLFCSTTGVLNINGHGADVGGIGGGSVTSANVSFNEWHYLLFQYNAATKTFELYVDGQKAWDKALDYNAYYQWADGEFHFGGFGLAADIDEVHVFNKALSADEVAQAYKNPASISSLTGYYTFDEETGNGGFVNLAANAPENTNATWTRYKGSAFWGDGVVNNGSYSNSAYPATLVEGRELTQTYSITVPAEIANVDYVMFNVAGSVLTNGQTKDGIEAGTAVSVTAAAVSGYVIAGLTVDGVDVVLTKTDAGQYTGSFEVNSDITADKIIFTTEAEAVEPSGIKLYAPKDGEVEGFDQITFTTTSGAGYDAGKTHILSPGETEVVLMAYPTEGAGVTALSINGVEYAVDGDMVFEFITVTEDITLESFKAITSGGTTTPTEIQVYAPTYGEVDGFNDITILNPSFKTLTKGQVTTFEPGTTLTVAATPSDATITALSINGVELPVGNDGSIWADFTPTQNVTLASFKAVRGAVSNVSFYVPAVNSFECFESFNVFDADQNQYDGGQAIELTAGSQVKIQAYPKDGYKVSEIRIKGQNIWAADYGDFLFGTYTVNETIAEGDITAVFEKTAPTTAAMTVEQPAGGVITVRNGDAVVESGAEVAVGTELTLSIALEKGYSLVNYTLNGQPVDGSTVTVPAEAFTISATLGGVDYCIPTGNCTRTSSDRGINSLNVNGTTITGFGTAARHALFADRTDNVVTVTPGGTLNILCNGAGEWMHTYVYIDFDGDGWDYEPDGITPGLDLVWYNLRQRESAGPAVLFDMEGNTYADNKSRNVNGINPIITLPADLAPGDYRVRYKIDWASANPCGNDGKANAANIFTGANGCGMIDFTLRVEAPKTYSLTLPESIENIESVMFNVAGTELGLGGTAEGIAAGTAVQVTAAAVSGFVIAGLTVDGVEVTLTKAESGEYTGTFEVNSDITADQIIFTTEAEPVSFYLPKEGEVAGFKKFYAWENNKELLSGTTYQFAPGTVVLIQAVIDNDAVTGLEINGVDTELPIKKVFGENSVYGNFTMTTEAVTLESFKAILPPAPAKYAMTLTQPEHATITVRNGEEVVEAGAELEAGTELTLSAEVEKGYSLVNFTLNDQPVDGNTVTVPEEAFTISATIGAVDYCMPTANINRTGRYITKLTINDVSIDGPGTTSRRKVGVDRTDNIVTVSAGGSLHIVASGTGEWMHPFFYIDFEGDGWTVDPEAHTVNGDLVWYKQMCPKSLLKAATGANNEVFYDMEGNVVSEEDCMYAQDFTVALPADIAPGDYRCRYKVDWAASDPCGNDKQAIESNAGVVIDFTLRVEAPQVVTYSITLPESIENVESVMFNVAGTEIALGGSAEGIAAGTAVQVTAAAVSGYVIAGLTVDGVEVTLTKAESGEYTGSFEINSDLTAENIIFTTAQAPVSFYVPADGSIDGIQSFEMSYVQMQPVEKRITMMGGQTYELAPGTEITVYVNLTNGSKVTDVTINGEALNLRNYAGSLYAKYVVKEAVTAESYAAVVPVPKFAMTLTQPEHATITVRNGEEVVEAGAELEAGTELTLSAEVEKGYRIVNYTLNDQPVEGNTVTVPEGAFTISATVGEVDYCAYLGSSTNAGRGINYLTVNGTTEVQGPGTADGRAVYSDQTATVVTHVKGDKLTIKSTGGGSWMHTFVYIDFDNDGWTVDPEATTPNGDLVWYQQLCPKSLLKATGAEVNNEQFYNINGTKVSEREYAIGGVTATITLPENIAPGEYRVRHKVDWAASDPCGNDQQDMGANGGSMIDFILRVVDPVYHTITLPESFTNVATATFRASNANLPAGETTTLREGTAVSLTATAAAGYEITGLTVAGNAVTLTFNEDTEVYSGSFTLDADVAAEDIVFATQVKVIPTEFTVTLPESFTNVGSFTFTYNGSDIPVGEATVIPADAEISVSATAAEKYDITGLKVGRKTEVELTKGEDGTYTGTFNLTEDLNAENIVFSTKHLPVKFYVPQTGEVKGIDHFTITKSYQTQTPGQTYEYEVGTYVTIMAYYADGYEVTGLRINGVLVNANKYSKYLYISYKVTEEDVTLESYKAVYNAPKHILTIDQPEHVTLTVRDIDGNEVTSGAEVGEEDELTVTANLEAGYKLVNFTLDGQPIEGNKFVMPTADATVSAEVAEIDYCAPTQVVNRSNDNVRYVSSLIVNGKTIEGQPANGSHPVFVDRTSEVITVTPGSTLSLETVGKGSWMHPFVYIDYGQDGWDVDTNAKTVNGDLVWYKVMRPANALTVGTNYDMEGNVVTNAALEIGGQKAEIQLPADLKAGDYRVRFKCDWASSDPCGHPDKANNDIGNNGGAVIDFIIRVADAVEHTVNISVAKGHSKAGSVKLEGYDSNSVTNTATSYTATATPAEGAQFLGWYNIDNQLVSEDAEYSFELFGSSNVYLFANFGWTVNLTANEGGRLAAIYTVGGKDIEIESGKTAAPGSSVTIYYSVEDGYTLKSLTLNDEELDVFEAEGEWTGMSIADADRKLDIVAEFEKAGPDIISSKKYVASASYEMEGSSESTITRPDIEAELRLLTDGSVSIVVSGFPVSGMVNEFANLKLNGTEIVGNYDNFTFCGSKLTNVELKGSFDSNSLQFTMTGRNVANTLMTFKFNGGYSGIGVIGLDGIDYDAEYYTLQGVRVAAENLSTGFYIVVKGSTATKVYICK